MDKYFSIDGEHLLGADKDLEYLKYAEAYKRTVMLLVEIFDQSYGYSDFDILPLLFNFRHYLELQMTGLIKYKLELIHAPQNEFIRFNEKSRSTHNLTFYLSNLIKYDQNINIPKDIEKFINDLNKIDIKGDSFRYPESNKGLKHYRSQMDVDFYEKLTTFSSLKEMMIKCINFLELVKEKYEFQKYPI